MKLRMKSNKQRRISLKARRKERKPRDIKEGLREGSMLPVDPNKIVSKSVMPTIPLCYRDKEFKCVDCGEYQIWTAKQQKWWYEEAGGEIETVAIRCRDCRVKERARKTLARKVHLDGISQKKRDDDEQGGE